MLHTGDSACNFHLFVTEVIERVEATVEVVQAAAVETVHEPHTAQNLSFAGRSSKPDWNRGS